MRRHGFDDLSLERIRSQLEDAVIMGLGSGDARRDELQGRPSGTAPERSAERDPSPPG